MKLCHRQVRLQHLHTKLHRGSCVRDKSRGSCARDTRHGTRPRARLHTKPRHGSSAFIPVRGPAERAFASSLGPDSQPGHVPAGHVPSAAVQAAPARSPARSRPCRRRTGSPGRWPAGLPGAAARTRTATRRRRRGRATTGAGRRGRGRGTKTRTGRVRRSLRGCGRATRTWSRASPGPGPMCSPPKPLPGRCA